MVSLEVVSNIDKRSRSRFLQFVCTKDTGVQDSGSNTMLNWKEDFWNVIQACASDHRSNFGDLQYPPTAPLSPLPLFLLHIGHRLRGLNLSHCDLESIPCSFALYFTNLESLNLSHNRLSRLPESFQNMTQRMKGLHEFRVSHNRLVSLPEDMFSMAGNEGLSSPLRVLDLSHNRLTCLPPLIPATLTCLEELLMDHNSLIEMTVSDLSRLLLKLPTLRHLAFEPQFCDDTIIQQQ